ncbi:MAG: cellulose binding domain-containing protein [Kineosporiaceae bacterium]
MLDAGREAAPQPRRPRRPRTGAARIAALLACGVAGALVGAGLVAPAHAVAPPRTSPPPKSTPVPFATSFEEGAEGAVVGPWLAYTGDDARTGKVSVLAEDSLSIGGLPKAWYDVTAWVKLPASQPDTRMTWDGGLGNVVTDGEWTQVTGHALAVGGKVTLSFETRCLLTVPQPWGFRVDDVSLVRSKDQFEYPVPAVKCRYPLPYEPVAHTYTFDTVEDVDAWSTDSRHVQLSLLKTSREGAGASLRADVAVPGSGVRLRGLAVGVYDVTGWIRSNMAMGLVEESMSPLAATRIPGGDEWTKFSWRVATGEDGSLTFDQSTFCGSVFPPVVTTFVLDDVSVVPAAGPVPATTVKPCPTTTPKPTRTKPTKSPKPTKTKPTKSPKPTKTPPTTTSGTPSSTSPTGSATTSPKPSCLATYRVVEAWDGGFTGELTVTSNVRVPYWVLSWRWPNGQQFRQATAVYVQQKGDVVTLNGAGIYPVIQAGVPLVLPFSASGTAGDSMPVELTLNGTACIGGL